MFNNKEIWNFMVLNVEFYTLIQLKTIILLSSFLK